MQDVQANNKNSDSEPQGDGRLNEALHWACTQLGLDHVDAAPVSGDASFRRYFRLQTDTGSVILMDAPPKQENSAPFVDIAGRLQRAGLHAPQILHFDLEQGFGLLEDLGDQLYRQILKPHSVDEIFPGLFDVLAQMANHVDPVGLPKYDHVALQTELDLFTDWYLFRHRNRILTATEMQSWQNFCNQLKQSAAAQPQTFVHRDFHSCNLLYRQAQKPGIIDFQDALLGPISYDFVSLLWDRYIPWPRDQMERWMRTHHQLLALDVEPVKWQQWCDWMSLQRNLKIVGIFARLHYRDHKPGYLEMIPVFYQYLLDVLALYPVFEDFRILLEKSECRP